MNESWQKSNEPLSVSTQLALHQQTLEEHTSIIQTIKLNLDEIKLALNTLVIKFSDYNPKEVSNNSYKLQELQGNLEVLERRVTALQKETNSLWTKVLVASGCVGTLLFLLSWLILPWLAQNAHILIK